MVVVLSSAGLQVPLIPLLEFVGNGAITDPIHTGDTALKAGVAGGLTVILMVAVAAH
ncbi:hypothetical protein D3C72_1226250 [compost metagenome]